VSNNDGLYTDPNEPVATRVNSIPLHDVDTRPAGSGSIGDLVSDATSQISTLVRSEIELAKAEIAGEAKKAGLGGGLLGAAGVIALFSLFFFFVFAAELLTLWVARWAAWLIIFIVMLVIAAVLALVGLKKVKTIKAPKKTVASVQEMKKLVPGKATKQLEDQNRGMYS